MEKLELDPDKFRYNIKNKINKYLNNDKYSTNIEKGIYNYTIKIFLGCLDKIYYFPFNI